MATRCATAARPGMTFLAGYPAVVTRRQMKSINGKVAGKGTGAGLRIDNRKNLPSGSRLKSRCNVFGSNLNLLSLDSTSVAQQSVISGTLIVQGDH